ncbi:MAG: bifunctional nuclease family protein [Anaerolineae bacterium]
MVEVTPHTVLGIGKSEWCIVLFKEADGPRLLPIWMRAYRAQPIVLWMKSIRLGRPQTHDLFIEVVEKLGAELIRIAVYGVEQGALLSRLILHKSDEQIALECRSSDGIAVALKKGIPITVADEIMEVAGFRPQQSRTEGAAAQSDGEEEELTAFKDFVEGLDLNGL